MIECHAGLAKQHRWLRACQYIYNPHSSTTLRRDVLAPQLPHQVRHTILATRTTTTRHVLATPTALRTHFHTFFNRLATTMLAALQRFLDSGNYTPLWDTLLTAIPKPNRDTTHPKNTRPISITCTWYRLLMKIFVARLSPYLPHLYTDAQHGFCPGCSCLTAITTVLLCTDLAALATPVHPTPVHPRP